MNDIYEIGFVILCFGIVVLLAYFEDNKEQKKWVKGIFKKTFGKILQI
jgi:hypothetical protein